MPHKFEEVIVDELVSVQPLQVPVKKLPSTAKKDPKMDQYQIAREIRLLAKHLTSIPPHVSIAQQNLMAVLKTARTSREKKLAAAEAYVREVHTYQENVAKQIGQIKVLAQQLPTVPNLPQSNAENVLRAFVAILKSNGVIQ